MSEAVVSSQVWSDNIQASLSQLPGKVSTRHRFTRLQFLNLRLKVSASNVTSLLYLGKTLYVSEEGVERSP